MAAYLRREKAEKAIFSGRTAVRQARHQHVVSSIEMRRLADMQQERFEREGVIAVHGAPQQKRALKERNRSFRVRPFSPFLSF